MNSGYTKGTPASSQIIWLEEKVKEQEQNIDAIAQINARLRDEKREANAEIERLREEYLSIEKQLGETQVRCSEIGERLLGEIERLRIHYDGTIMYGNRLVDLIDWAERNGIEFPAKIYNPCVIAIDHFRNERERLKESK